jgi:hypothetical protein
VLISLLALPAYLSCYAESQGKDVEPSQSVLQDSQGLGSSREVSSQRRDELELKKLELEIAALQKPFWLEASFYLSVLTALLAGIGLYIGRITGFFENQRILLNIKKEKLAIDIEGLKAERVQIRTEIYNLKAEFLNNMKSQMEHEVEIFLLKESDQVLSGNIWLYQNGRLSSVLYPDYFSAVEIPKKYFEKVNEYLSQVAWDTSYDFTAIEQAELRSPPRQERIENRPMEFHTWISLRDLLSGDPKWLKAHAMECTYDEKKAENAYSNIMKLREHHRKCFLSSYVAEFPPFKVRLQKLIQKYGIKTTSSSENNV